MDKMRAILKKEPGPGFVLEEVPRPEISADDVLVRVRMAGICGTDVHIHRWNEWARGRIRLPRILGHEFVGEVAEVGERVSGVKAGALVTAEGHFSCGICTLCRTGHAHVCRETRILGIDTDGAFAEYVRVPAANVWPIDEGIPLEWAAIHDPLGNAFHVVLTADVGGKTVLVTGCGPIGLFAVGVARAAGASRVFATEIDAQRPHNEDLEKIILDETRGEGVHVVLEMSGDADAIHQGLRVVRNSGRVQWLGIPRGPLSLEVDKHVIFKGLTIYGVTGRLMYKTWYAMRSFLLGKRYDPSGVITNRVPMARFEDGFATAAAGHSGKVIIDMSGNES